MPMAVCCLDDEGAWGSMLKAEGYDVGALRRRTGFQPALGRRIAQMVTRHRADVIHCHHYSPFVYSAIARSWQAFRQDRVHGTRALVGCCLPSPKRRLANRLLSHAPHQVFTVSGDLKRAYRCGRISLQPGRRHLQRHRHRPTASRGGTDADPRAMLGLTDDTFVIGTVARLDPVKDLEMLIRRSPNPRRPGPRGPARHRRRRRASLVWRPPRPRPGAADAIRFLGHRDDARDLLAGCDVYANSSISEGVSLTILEAMAAGLPVVATRVGGTPEVIDDTCARLVPARDPGAMAAALSSLADAPDLRAALGRAGRARVETRFTLDRMVREYRDAYFRARRRGIAALIDRCTRAEASER